MWTQSVTMKGSISIKVHGKLLYYRWPVYISTKRKHSLTLRPASLLWRFMSILANSFERLAWFFSLSRMSTKYLPNWYPYCKLSPHPPHIQSLLSSAGRGALLQPHEWSSPSRHALLTAWTTPAADIAWVNAASLLAEKTKHFLIL